MSHKELATSFDGIAEDYGRYRTSYPVEIIDKILTLTGLPPAIVKACEIGCGTGQATLDFARSGITIVAVEPGNNLISLAVTNLKDFPSVSFINSKFENANLTPQTFDLVFAAQSFHWIDPETAYALVSRILRPNGLFAAFWKREGPNLDELHLSLNLLFQKYIFDFEPQTLAEYEEEAVDRIQALVASQQFHDCEFLRIPQPIMTESAREFTDSLGTWSAVARLEPEVRKTLLSEVFDTVQRSGGQVRNGPTEVLIIYGYRDNSYKAPPSQQVKE